MVFDITQRETLDLLETWMNELKENNKINVNKLLIGNNSDFNY